MFNDFRWGGISVRGFIRTLLPDVWMVFACMIITYLATGIAAPLLYTPKYLASTVVAAYPDNTLAPIDYAGERLETAVAVNGVLGSKAFQSGLKELLVDSDERYITSYNIQNTNLIQIEVSSFSAEDAYNTVRILIDYYNSIAEQLTGNRVVEVVVQPEIPLEPDNIPTLYKYRLLLTLFMGVAMGGFLAFLYVIRKTYKTAGTVCRQYKDTRFFRLPPAPAGKFGLTGRKKKMRALRQSAVRKTAEELRQMLRTADGKSILITSAAKGEGKSDFACELADELASLGRSVLLVEADFESAPLTAKAKKEGNLPEKGILDCLSGQCALPDVCVKHADKNILTAYAGLRNAHDDSQNDFTQEDVKKVMEEAVSLADIILVDSGAWGGTGDGKFWNSAADFSLALCAPDKAGFFAEDQLVADLSDGQSEFVGIILNGF